MPSASTSTKGTNGETAKPEPVIGKSNGNGRPVAAISPAPAGEAVGNGRAPRHVLAFEKPLAQLEEQIQAFEVMQSKKQVDCSAELRDLRANYTSLLRKTYDNLTAWETVQVARHPQRPLFRDYVDMLCPAGEFRELHGDRAFGDDPAIVCGMARLRGGAKVMLVGHHKGRDTAERLKCHFGMAHPEGYRKALRCMKLAEKFGLPVVCLVDTMGAYPGIGAEERGQAESIARNMLEMARLRTPIVTVVTGEGGSGGALGLGVADRVAMMEFAWYSVISPEACSSILFKGNEATAQLADSLKLTSKDLKPLGVVDAVVPEPLGGAHRDPHTAAYNLEQYVAKTLKTIVAAVKKNGLNHLLEKRYDRFRKLGKVAEGA